MQADAFAFNSFGSTDFSPVGILDGNYPPYAEGGMGGGGGGGAPQQQPSGEFQRRDTTAGQQKQQIVREQIPPIAPAVQVAPGTPVANSPPPMHALPPQGATGGGGGYAVEQEPQRDIKLPPEPFLGGGADIGNYKRLTDIFYILIGVIFIEVIVLFAVRFLPDMFGGPLNRWYDLFGLNAVIADVLIIVIGFLIARYVYTGYVQPRTNGGQYSGAWFTATAVGVQLIHDLAFYFGVITQVPRGSNLMMDVFKDYAASGGAKILGGDAAMMIGSALSAMYLKTLPGYIVTFFAAVCSYAIPYVLYTKNQYSVLK